VATNRIVKIAQRIIKPSQTAFLPSRNIMERAIILHETLHDMHRKILRGVIPNLVEDGLSILKYVDDTIIFMDHDLKQAKNLKLILYVFEQLSGLKINFHKSEIFCFGAAKDSESLYSHLFGCKLATYLFHYLGIKIHFTKLNNKD
ncbi:hypothetical protein U9M48_032512, partial [Paspalum notatum var. saurae]